MLPLGIEALDFRLRPIREPVADQNYQVQDQFAVRERVCGTVSHAELSVRGLGARRASAQAVGTMFWFRWKKFVGSYLFFSATSRRYLFP